MKITRVSAPPPPPAEVRLEFPKDSGWVIAAALHDYAAQHPEAWGRDDWFQWSKDLYKELRRQ